MSEAASADPLLSPGEALKTLDGFGLKIGASTLRRYAASGQLRSKALPSGHRRYRRADVIALVSGHTPTSDPTPDVA